MNKDYSVDRPYEIIDKFGDVIATYGTQDRLMYDFFTMKDTAVSFTYTDDNETTHLLGYGTEARFVTWRNQMEQLHLAVRLRGTDFMGIAEFLEFSEHLPTVYTQSAAPLTEIDFLRYGARVDQGIPITSFGACRIEALAQTYIAYKTIYG